MEAAGEVQPREGSTMNVQDAISLQNQKASRLLRLPAELRIKIYEYALSGFRVMPLKINDPQSFVPVSGPLPEDGSKNYRPKRVLALTATCRQIHAETRGLFFTMNALIGTANGLNRRFPNDLIDLSLAHRFAKMCIVVRSEDIVGDSNGSILREPLAKLLNALPELRMLKLVILGFKDPWNECSWELVKGRLFEEARQALNVSSRLGHLELDVVQWQKGDEERYT